MNHAEQVLLAHLTDPDSLDHLVREGFTAEANRECIPTVTIRDIVAWVLDYYFRSGRKLAPTVAGITATWGEEMEKYDQVIDDSVETDPIEWAVDQLRAQDAEVQAQDFTIRFATDLGNAAPGSKVSVVKEAAGNLYALSQRLSSHHQEAPADLGFAEAWARYEERAVARRHITGLTLGLDEIDEHTLGVKDGELAIFAAFSGAGKSWQAIKAARSEWIRGRQTVLYTLENDLEMTFDRMACQASGVSYERWQRGTVDEGSLKRFHLARERYEASAHSPIVIQPGRGDRDPVSLIRRAYSIGAESVIIDQTSHLERVPGSKSRERRDIVAEQVREVKTLISEGREKIPCLLLTQINREGHKAAVKSGGYDQSHLAESSEAERSADFVFSVLATPSEGREDAALWQTLKARRVPPKDWELIWRLGVGDMRVVREAVDA